MLQELWALQGAHVHVPSGPPQKSDRSGQEVGVVKMVIWGAWLVQSQAFMQAHANG